MFFSPSCSLPRRFFFRKTKLDISLLCVLTSISPLLQRWSLCRCVSVLQKTSLASARRSRPRKTASSSVFPTLPRKRANSSLPVRFGVTWWTRARGCWHIRRVRHRTTRSRPWACCGGSGPFRSGAVASLSTRAGAPGSTQPPSLSRGRRTTRSRRWRKPEAGSNASTTRARNRQRVQRPPRDGQRRARANKALQSRRGKVAIDITRRSMLAKGTRGERRGERGRSQRERRGARKNKSRTRRL